MSLRTNISFVAQIFILILLIHATYQVPYCPQIKNNMLNVHLVPHTHDDVGWVKTVDDYYHSQVQSIIDSAISALEANPERKFIYVEMAFLWRWWNARSSGDQQRMINLVNSGQLEFIGGGWSMADEAAEYYVDLIDEMTWGYRFLNDTFGPVAVPKVAWQIDPFGHSKGTASLFALMGYDGLFFGRLDYQDQAQRQKTKTMEMIWQASANMGAESQLFTGALYNQYQCPPGFCFDVYCSDYIDDSGQFNNVNSKVNSFIDYVNNQSLSYATNNIIITMGGDFQFQVASKNFDSMDLLIKYVNQKQEQGSNVNVFYSTPSCYLNALNQANEIWTVKTDDFMPYASDDHAYWTGYFTSRAAFKGYAKYTCNFLQIAKQLVSYGNVGHLNEENLAVLKRYQGDAQHHDAITGTAKQFVNDDYTKSMADGLEAGMVAINSAFYTIIPLKSNLPPQHQSCPYLNVSYCPLTQTPNSFIITVYNPMGHAVTAHVRVPVNFAGYSVSRSDGSNVPIQVVPVPKPVLDDPIRNLQSNNINQVSRKKSIKPNFPITNDLVFNAVIPPSGFTSFFVQKNGGDNYQPLSYPNPTMNDVTIKNKYLLVTVDGHTGLLKSITDLVSSKVYNVNQNFYYYKGWAGYNYGSADRASGAYIFRPNGTKILLSAKASIAIVNGTEVQEIHQSFVDFVSQVIRLYPDENKVEMEWMIGPIPVADNIGKEIVSLYSTDFATNGIYYTDSNGREVLQRKRNYRPTWNVQLAENISGNYYPINSRIYIQDTIKNKQLTVITDRSEGGGSIEDGTIEVMLHRRLLLDDALGVGEALNEPGVDGKGLRVRGKHWLMVSPVSKGGATHRPAALQASNPPFVFIAPLVTSPSDYSTQFTTNFSGLTTPLPDNVHLLTVEPWKDGAILLRLEHFYEIADDPNGLSTPITVNVQKLFTNFEITSMTETTLGANVWLKDSNRLFWMTTTPIDEPNFPKPKNQKPFDVYLQPMQIRTFVVTVSYYP